MVSKGAGQSLIHEYRLDIDMVRGNGVATVQGKDFQARTLSKLSNQFFRAIVKGVKSSYNGSLELSLE